MKIKCRTRLGSSLEEPSLALETPHPASALVARCSHHRLLYNPYANLIWKNKYLYLHVYISIRFHPMLAGFSKCTFHLKLMGAGLCWLSLGL